METAVCNDLPCAIISRILLLAVDGSTTSKTCPRLISKAIRCEMDCDDCTIEMLLAKHGTDGEESLIRLAGKGKATTVKLLLGRKDRLPRADCRGGEALCQAAKGGHVEVAKLLLSWREHAPMANCQDGWALCCAARGGHAEMVKLLLTWREHAPRADCRGGSALCQAA